MDSQSHQIQSQILYSYQHVLPVSITFSFPNPDGLSFKCRPIVMKTTVVNSTRQPGVKLHHGPREGGCRWNQSANGFTNIAAPLSVRLTRNITTRRPEQFAIPDVPHCQRQSEYCFFCNGVSILRPLTKKHKSLRWAFRQFDPRTVHGVINPGPCGVHTAARREGARYNTSCNENMTA